MVGGVPIVCADLSTVRTVVYVLLAAMGYAVIRFVGGNAQRFPRRIGVRGVQGDPMVPLRSSARPLLASAGPARTCFRRSAEVGPEPCNGFGKTCGGRRYVPLSARDLHAGQGRCKAPVLTCMCSIRGRV